MNADSLFQGFQPAGRRPVLPNGDVAYAVHDTAVGRLLLAVTAADRLVTVAFSSSDDSDGPWLSRLAKTLSPRVLRQPRRLDAARRELDDYLAGSRHTFGLRTDPALATDFQRQVLATLAGVGYGERSTYGALARQLGRPSASRAVGTALGANPLCIVVPCHRIVSSTGALTGYAGGLAAKEYLLQLEEG